MNSKKFESSIQKILQKSMKTDIDFSILKKKLHFGCVKLNPKLNRFIYDKVKIFFFKIEVILERLKILYNFLKKIDKSKILFLFEKNLTFIEDFCVKNNFKFFHENIYPGIFSNPNLIFFTEVEYLLIIDPFLFKKIIKEVNNFNVKIISLMNSSDIFVNIDFIIPLNWKNIFSLKSFFYYLENGSFE